MILSSSVLWNVSSSEPLSPDFLVLIAFLLGLATVTFLRCGHTALQVIMVFASACGPGESRLTDPKYWRVPQTRRSGGPGQFGTVADSARRLRFKLCPWDTIRASGSSRDVVRLFDAKSVGEW